MTTDDMELVAEYARQGSEPAFATLVSRYVNLVYSVALRRLGDAHLAQEVAQAVFIILARKAGSLGPRTILSAWLCRTAQFVAADALRTQRRRQNREQELYMQSLSNQTESENSHWLEIAPLLDSAMAGLGEKDHSAIVLRFFEGKDLSQIGAALGVSENAAKKRVHHALEKLRRYFSKRGTVSTTAIIGSVMLAHSVQAAPATLAKTVTALAITKGATASGTTLLLVKGTMKIMTWLKATTFAVILINAFVSQQIVATHYDLAGNPNGWMTRSQSSLFWLMVAVGFPLYFLAIGYLLRFLPIKTHTFKLPNRDYWLAPERRSETFAYLFRHFQWQACLAAIFALTILLLDLQANHQTPPHLSTPLALAAGGCFAAATIVWVGVMLRHFKRAPAAR